MKFSLRKNKNPIIVLVILIILFLIFSQKSSGFFVKNFFYPISQPIQKSLLKSGNNFSDFFVGLFEGQNLKKENEELNKKYSEVLSQIVALEELKKENETLRKALEVQLNQDFQLVMADLISKDVTGDSILINKGSKSGILVGMPVMTEQKVVMGKISEVYENYSRVILISNKEKSFPVEIQGKDIKGILKGIGDFHLSLEEIPNDKEIKDGDIVITTSLGGDFPKGLLIGEIKNIEKSDIKPFQNAEVSPLFNIKDIETIFIITSF